MKLRNTVLSAIAALAIATPASAALVSVLGGPSSAGTFAAIVPAPPNVNDLGTFTGGLQGFNEAIGVLLAAPLDVDAIADIAAGTLVDSHMIFLNREGFQNGPTLTHIGVEWTFDGIILGTMTDVGGTLEAASNALLGNIPGTLYPGAFRNRGLEGGDSFSVSGNVLTTNFIVSDPGDWIRVVTVSAVPLPAALPLFAGGLALMGLFGRRKKRQAITA